MLSIIVLGVGSTVSCTSNMASGAVFVQSATIMWSSTPSTRTRIVALLGNLMHVLGDRRTWNWRGSTVQLRRKLLSSRSDNGTPSETLATVSQLVTVSLLEGCEPAAIFRVVLDSTYFQQNEH